MTHRAAPRRHSGPLTIARHKRRRYDLLAVLALLAVIASVAGAFLTGGHW